MLIKSHIISIETESQLCATGNATTLMADMFSDFHTAAIFADTDVYIQNALSCLSPLLTHLLKLFCRDADFAVSLCRRTHTHTHTHTSPPFPNLVHFALQILLSLPSVIMLPFLSLFMSSRPRSGSSEGISASFVT